MNTREELQDIYNQIKLDKKNIEQRELDFAIQLNENEAFLKDDIVYLKSMIDSRNKETYVLDIHLIIKTRNRNLELIGTVPLSHVRLNLYRLLLNKLYNISLGLSLNLNLNELKEYNFVSEVIEYMNEYIAFEEFEGEFTLEKLMIPSVFKKFVQFCLLHEIECQYQNVDELMEYVYIRDSFFNEIQDFIYNDELDIYNFKPKNSSDLEDYSYLLFRKVDSTKESVRTNVYMDYED